MLDALQAKMTALLLELPTSERLPAMAECEQLANGNLQAELTRSSPQAWAADLMSQPGLKRLAKAAERSGTNPQFAESPQDLILRLLPSDGHSD